MENKLGRHLKGVDKLWTSTEQRVWITLNNKYPCVCDSCGVGIAKGAKFRWNKETKEKRHMKCGVR